MSEDIEEGIDSSGGGYQHTEAEIVEAFYRAGKTISCAHAVFPARSKSTGKWFPVLMFFSQDTKVFSHAFRLDSPKQVTSLVEFLTGCAGFCAKRNGG